MLTFTQRVQQLPAGYEYENDIIFKYIPSAEEMIARDNDDRFVHQLRAAPTLKFLREILG